MSIDAGAIASNLHGFSPSKLGLSRSRNIDVAVVGSGVVGTCNTVAISDDAGVAVSSLTEPMQIQPIFGCRAVFICPSKRGLSSMVFGFSKKLSPEMFKVVFLVLVPTSVNEVWIGFTSGSSSSYSTPVQIGNASVMKNSWRDGVQTDSGVDVPNSAVAVSSGSMGSGCTIQVGSEVDDGTFFHVDMDVMLVETK